METQVDFSKYGLCICLSLLKYKQPRSYSQFLNFYLELSNDDPGIPAYDDNACSIECAELSPGEHCESSLKQCQCGNEPSCIGTAKPFCDKGECKGIQERILYNFYYI